MALFKFTRAILEDQPIDIYNHGDMRRDFTYIDDLIQAVTALTGDSLSPVAPRRVVNIGNAALVQLLEFFAAIETATGRTARHNLLPMQPGDMPAT